MRKYVYLLWILTHLVSCDKGSFTDIDGRQTSDNASEESQQTDYLKVFLSGKKIAWFGDSITEGYGEFPYGEKYGWATPIQRDFGAICYNQGISGATLRDQTVLGRTCIPFVLKQFVESGSIADYYILSGGFNDRDNSSRWGMVNKNVYKEYSEMSYETTIESLEKMIAYCMLFLPERHYGFIICYDINDVTESPGWEPSHWNELADRLIEVCKKWGMPYLDLRETCGFNLCSDEMRKIYGIDLSASAPEYNEANEYSAGDTVKYKSIIYCAIQDIHSPAGKWNEELWDQVSDKNGFDRAHCNRFAYDKMARVVASWILTL